jgi:adenylate cyclase
MKICQLFHKFIIMNRAHQIAAIMFTDIQGYTALMQQNKEKAVQFRDKHRQIFTSVTEKYNGKILQYYGDDTLSVFVSAIDTVRCGLKYNWVFRKILQFRSELQFRWVM